MTKKLRRVRINREKWVRGGKDGSGNESPTYLCNKHDQRCCLGFAMNQISRIPYSRLLNKCEPIDATARATFLTTLTEDCGAVNNRLTDEAMGVNDGIMSEAERESQLIKLFRKNGIILTFYGKTHDDLARSNGS